MKPAHSRSHGTRHQLTAGCSPSSSSLVPYPQGPRLRPPKDSARG